MVNHAMENETAKLLIYFGHMADHVILIRSDREAAKTAISCQER